MKNFAAILLILVLAISLFSQEPDSDPVKESPNKPVPEAKGLGETEEFQNAFAQPLAPDRIAALQKFLEKYPESKSKIRALEIIASSRAEIADEKLRTGEADEGIRLFKLAVTEAPSPVSDKFFSGLLVKFPANLFFRGQRNAAVDVAQMIEKKIADNPTQLLGLATFYLSIEQASEAKRLANRSIELKPDSAAAYHTLGFAHRLDFDLEKASEAYSKSLELDANSLKAKSSLAEMKRALGMPDEATALYREILEAEPENAGALTGMTLSLFDGGNREEAEKELAKNLETNPKNLSLLVGAAYWYAANGEGARAVAVAQQAIAAEPRYTWAYIALARGFIATGKPMAAERTILAARRYGNFPTLSYELAVSQFAAGFYQEAAEGLKQHFTIEDGLIKTKLGGRVEKTAAGFQDLLSSERRASIFQFASADRIEDSKKLKELLEFSSTLDSPDFGNSEIEEVADEFISGDDGMKFHRQIFVANQLLNKKRALGKVLTITEEAVSGVDSALTVSSPVAAVLADELYTSRKIALSRGETIIVPNIPRQTLSKIVRGRIEEISGWTLFQQDKPAEAIARLRLAVSVLPADSAWSRSSYWKLGTVLESVGKPKQALDAYIRGYSLEEQNAAKKLVIENVYTRLNGNLDGFEATLRNKAPNNETASIFTIKPPNDDEDAKESPKETVVEDAASQETSKQVTTDENVPPKVSDEKPVVSAIEVISVIEPDSDSKSDPILNSQEEDENTADAVPSEEKIPVVLKKSDRSAADTILDPNTNISELPPIPAEEKPAEEKVDKPAKAALRLPEPIFEPIIINVPETAKPKTEAGTDANREGATEPKPNEPSDVKGDERSKPDEKADDPTSDSPSEKQAETDDRKGDEKSKPDEKADDPSTDSPTEKQAENEDDADRSALERPRIVKEDKPADDPAEKKAAEPQTCDILISQESVSIINSGGSIGVLIGLEEGKGDPKKIKAISSSPEDVEVILEPDIGSLSERAFFVVRSISEKLGLYNLVFETPCGKKTIKVNVR